MTCRPGPLLLRCFAGLCAFALLAAAEPLLVWPLYLALLLLLAACLVEWRSLRPVRLQLERRPVLALSLGEAEQVQVALASDAAWPISLVLRQCWPSLVERRAEERPGRCRPGAALPLVFELRGVRRGSETLPPPHVAFSRWGLVERVVPVGERGLLHVLPNLKAIGRYQAQLDRFVLAGQGNRTAPRLGKGREFDRLRDYVQGDDQRDVAWKASARHDRLIVREFRLDRSQEIQICADSGHRMAARVGTLTRLDHALDAALMLSYMAHRMEDRVGLLSFAAEVEPGVGCARGATHLRRLTRFASGVREQFLHSDYLALAADLRRRLRHRTLVLLLTSLPEPGEGEALVRAMRLLMPQHLPLVVVQGDPDLAAAARTQPADRDELCDTLVAREIWHGRQRLMQELRGGGAWVVEARPQDSGVAAINAYLEIKRRQLL